jgi:hypothetical protein
MLFIKRLWVREIIYGLS